MSVSQYRVADVQSDAIGWIETDTVIADILGVDGDVLPVAIARESDADPRVSVGASLVTGSRGNDRDDLTFEVRVIVDGTIDYVKSNATHSLTDLKDEVTHVLTRHRSNFYSPEVQADEEVAFSDPLNRYMGVVSVAISRRERPE